MHFIFFSQLFEFDQSEFFGGSPDSAYMDAIGYVYVPESCQNGEGECMCCSLNSVCLLMLIACVFKFSACRLHIAFHGCKQGRQVPSSKTNRLYTTSSVSLQ